MEWKPLNVIPEDGVPILISFEDREYPEVGCFYEYEGQFFIYDEYAETDIPTEKVGKANGWMPLPKCKKA